MSQQQAQNITQFSYLTSDVNQLAPAIIVLDIACPFVTKPPSSVEVSNHTPSSLLSRTP